ncbi:PREDICTED: acrosin-like, partial [Acanthisitta chloris]|uniref:acrosin-like n=1 Tax=Acanthisitta chloris TaxID=57068 RepID=UPI0004F0CD61
MAVDYSSVIPGYNSTADGSSQEDSTNGTERVVGGTGVQPGAWPGIASIQVTLNNGTWHVCAGSLIHPRWVLTAAHFLSTGRDVINWDVVIGATNLAHLGPETRVRKIQRVLVHPHYVAATKSNNIALVELDQPVECSEYIQLGCVPDTSLRVMELRHCYIAGWGVTSARAHGPGLVLQEAKVRLIDVQLCNSSRRYAGAVNPHSLCAEYPRGGANTCQADSGGPLTCKDNSGDYFWLVGVTS